jgi:hypothetical protein
VVSFISELLDLSSGDVGSAEDAREQTRKRPAPGASPPAASSSAAAETGDAVPGKLLVFAYHQSVLDSLEEQLCQHQGLGYIRIDGKTAAQTRQALVHRFQTDPSVRLGLLSIRAAGAGLTLTAADKVVFAELHWNPSDLQQCEDRVHRIGQGQHCKVYYCTAANSADGLMWGVVARKMLVVGATVDGQEAVSSGEGLTLRDMQQWEILMQSAEDTWKEAGGTATAGVLPTAAAAAAAREGAAMAAAHQDPPGLVPGPAGPAGAADGEAETIEHCGARRRSLLEAFIAAQDMDDDRGGKRRAGPAGKGAASAGAASSSVQRSGSGAAALGSSQPDRAAGHSTAGSASCGLDDADARVQPISKAGHPADEAAGAGAPSAAPGTQGSQSTMAGHEEQQQQQECDIALAADARATGLQQTCQQQQQDQFPAGPDGLGGSCGSGRPGSEPEMLLTGAGGNEP